MSGKKYRPALFELLGKGTVKPNQNGSISTPEWMRGQQKHPFAWFFRKRSNKSRQPESVVTIHGEKTAAPPAGLSSVVPLEAAKPPVPAMVVPRPAITPVSTPPKIAPVSPDAQRPSAPEKPAPPGQTAWISRVLENRVKFTVSYWVLGLAALALLFLILLAFRIGKISGQAPAVAPGSETPESAPVSSSEKLKEIQRTEPRKDILPEYAARPGPADAAKETVPPAPTNAAAVRKGLCLVICSHTNLRELGQVQAYFARKGVPAEIGQFDNRYVLYSLQTFDTITLAKQSKLKDTVVELGRRYNSEREKGAAIFQPRTFESAWWINIEKIRPVR